jgi:hypothetical protein
VAVSEGSQEQTRPVTVSNYKLHISGVRLQNKRLQPYLLELKKGIKWYFKLFQRLHNVSQDSSVGIVTGYGLHDQGGGSLSPYRVKNVQFSISSRPALGSTQPPVKWVLGALSRGVKRQGCEADHSPPTSAEVKKMWIYTSIPPYVFMA